MSGHEHGLPDFEVHTSDHQEFSGKFLMAKRALSPIAGPVYTLVKASNVREWLITHVRRLIQ
jgi:hypothetical protein